jgi:lipopolysaccharide biosynthesis glycosyltransferase
MPCLAMGTPVAFAHDKPADRRFEGLIDVKPEDVEAMKSRIKGILSKIFQAIMEGQDEIQVYSKWQELCESEMQNTTRYLQRCSQKHSISIDIDPKMLIAQIPITKIGNSECPSLVHVCFAIGDDFTQYLINTALSLLANSSRQIHLHVLTRNVKKKEINVLLKHETCACISQYDCTQIDYGSIKLIKHITISAMDRIIIPELLHHVEKAIYLDTDILVRKDIAILWDTPLEDYLLAARPSIHKRWHKGASIFLDVAEKTDFEEAIALRTHIFDTGPVDFRCINSGVLLMNLEKMRNESLVPYMMSLSRKFELLDEISMNIAIRSNYVKLPPEWNHFYSQETLEDPAIIHYVGPLKPWDYSQLPYASEWKSYRSLLRPFSPFAGKQKM